MTSGAILDLWREALSLLATLSAPFLVTGLVVGLLIAIVQTATQLQESMLAFVPKLLVALAVMALAGHWALEKLNRFTTTAFTAHVEQRAGTEGP